MSPNRGLADPHRHRSAGGPPGPETPPPQHADPNHSAARKRSALRRNGSLLHKIVTGVIAGTTGIALLLGGAGTFALWNAEASTQGGTVASGTLSLRAVDDGRWTDVTNGRSAVIRPADVRMVPGNTYRFRQTLQVEATGDDMAAALTYQPQSITGDRALVDATERTLSVTSDSGAVTQSAPGSNTFDVSPSDATTTVEVLFTIALPESAETGQDGTVDVSGLTFTLQQRTIGS